MSTLAAYLIGPLDNSPLDICLQKSFPTAAFFQHGETPSLEARPHLLLLEPLSRPLPLWVWEYTGLRVGMGSWPSGFHAQSAREILRSLDAFLPLDECMALFCQRQEPSLPIHPLWILHPGHQGKAELPQVFSHAYVLERSYSPQLKELENEDTAWTYFQEMAQARLPFYFQRSAHLRLDLAYGHSLHWQALASGAQVSVPHPLNVEGLQCTPQDDAWWLLQAEGPLPLMHIRLPEILEQLQGIQPQGPPAHPLFLQALQLSLCQAPRALAQLKNLLNILPPSNARLLLCCAFFQRLYSSPFRQGDPQEILRQEARARAPLQSNLDGLMAHLMRAWLCKDYTTVLSLLGDLQAQELSSSQCPGAWLSDPLYLGLEALYPERSLPLFWHYQQVVAWSFTGEYTRALRQLEELLERAYLPWACSLWLQLREHAAARLSLSQLRAQHPQQPQLLEASLRERVELFQSSQNQNQALNHNFKEQLRQDMAQACSMTERLLTQRAHLESLWELQRAFLLSASPAADAEGLPQYVIWEGPLRAYSSLAGINRQWLARLLADPEMRVTHLPFDPPELPPDPVWEALKNTYPQRPELLVSHRWPPREAPPIAGRWVNIVPWEFGLIPQEWAARFNKSVDRLWVPSKFVRRSFIHSGVRPQRLTVIPNGVDTELFHPQGPEFDLPTAKSLRFLFVGGTVHRKGVDLLIKAFSSAFSAADDVALIIKSFGADSHYVLTQEVLGQSPPGTPADLPEIHILQDDLQPGELAALYRSCDVYVHPYRGEGFGMPILEAMASGLPVIIPNAGPAPEFCPVEASWQVWTRICFESSRDVHGQGRARSHPYFTVCDLPHLIQCLRAAYTQTEARQQRAQKALQAAQNYSWDRLYTQLRAEIQKLCRPSERESEEGSESLWPGALRLDFAHFRPKENSSSQDRGVFQFLCICDWENDCVVGAGAAYPAWQDLIRAYAQSFGEQDAVHLILHPVGEDFEAMSEALIQWLEAEGLAPEHLPPLSFEQADLSPEGLPALYHQADCFVLAHNHGQGEWALRAQACGVPVISCGHLPFLERPLSEVFRAGDVAHLAWLLKSSVQDLKAERGAIVRQYLEYDHHPSA